MSDSLSTTSATDLIRRMRLELEADLALWESLLDQIEATSGIHALLGLRVASIKATLDDIAA